MLLTLCPVVLSFWMLPGLPLCVAPPLFSSLFPPYLFVKVKAYIELQVFVHADIPKT